MQLLDQKFNQGGAPWSPMGPQPGIQPLVPLRESTCKQISWFWSALPGQMEVKDNALIKGVIKAARMAGWLAHKPTNQSCPIIIGARTQTKGNAAYRHVVKRTRVVIGCDTH